MPAKMLCAGAMFCLVTGVSHANTLTVSVADSKGENVGGAVVWATPSFELGEGYAPEAREMVQQNKQFWPHILVVQQGADIAFPNRDNIKHHVYSFSSPKSFEFRVYKDNPPTPLTFDKVGEVELGCNIHDWMLGYIKVVDTPFFVRTDASGQAVLADLPQGDYTLNVWHPRIQNKDNGQSTPIAIDADATRTISLNAEFLPAIEGYDDYDLESYQ